MQKVALVIEFVVVLGSSSSRGISRAGFRSVAKKTVREGRRKKRNKREEKPHGACRVKVKQRALESGQRSWPGSDCFDSGCGHVRERQRQRERGEEFLTVEAD